MRTANPLYYDSPFLSSFLFLETGWEAASGIPTTAKKYVKVDRLLSNNYYPPAIGIYPPIVYPILTSAELRALWWVHERSQGKLIQGYNTPVRIMCPQCKLSQRSEVSQVGRIPRRVTRPHGEHFQKDKIFR
jgi:hypothetical protein